MANRSHFNSGLRALNQQNRDGIQHSSHVSSSIPSKTYHQICIGDAFTLLSALPPESIQLLLIDPPYNLAMDTWDQYEDYISWAKHWITLIPQLLTPTGNCVIFGGMQYQGEKSGDLLELMHHIRHHSDLRLVNVIIWYYKYGMSAHRFFANRHEELVWYGKTKGYYFDLDAVRIPYDESTKAAYKRDKRLNPATIDKGKNPTNVWEIGRLHGNSKERVGHPTQKPAALIRRIIRGLSFPGSIVVDPFAGSGVTGKVCIEERRHSIQMDTNPQLKTYFDKQLAPLPKKIKQTAHIELLRTHQDLPAFIHNRMHTT